MTKITGVGRRIVGTLGLPARLLERSRGRKRLALLTLYLLIGAIVCIFAWREASLRGLPDIGDPFDVAAFKSERTPSADDAFPLYQRAFARLKPFPQNLNTGSAALRNSLESGRPPDRPGFHRWSEQNAEALELWRLATEKPDVNWPSEAGWFWKISQSLNEFSWLAAEQARRAEDDANRSEAWKWERAILRSYRHFTRRGHNMARMIAPRVTNGVVGQIWPIPAEVDDRLLRRMLVDLKAIDAMTPPDSETIKAEYLNILESLPSFSFEAPSPSDVPKPLWYEYNPAYIQAKRYFRHEPERSRRLLRILVANQLAYADLPSSNRPPFVPPGMFDATSDPSAPRAARLLDPNAAAAWAEASVLKLGSIHDLQGCIDLGDRDRHAIEYLLLEVAHELYRRDHSGAEPPNDAALVGPYLDRLPELSAAAGGTLP